MTKWGYNRPHQRAFQFVGDEYGLPAEQNAQPDGRIGNSPYWNCGECGEPVFDFENAPYYTLEEVSEEIETGGVVDDATIKRLQESFIKTEKELPAVINNEFRPDKNFSSFRILANDLSTAAGEVVKRNFSWFNEIYKRFSNTQQGYNIRERFLNITYLPFMDEIDRVFNANPHGTVWDQINSHPDLLEPIRNKCLALVQQVKPVSDDIMREMMELRGYRLAKQETVEVKHPICQKCYDEQVYKCEEPGCDFETLDDDEIVEVTTKVRNDDPDEVDELGQGNLKGIKEPSTGRGWGDDHPGYRIETTILCKEHGAECDVCGKGLNKSDEDVREYEGEWFHYDCFWERYTTCDACGDIIYTDESRWDEDTDETYCENCFKENEKTDTVDQDKAKPIIRNIMENRPNLYPLDEKTISGNIIPVLELAGKKFSYTQMEDEEKIKSWVMKRIQKPDAKAAVEAEFETNETVAGLVKTFERNVEYQQRMRKQYPKLKGFRPIPVDVRVEPSTTHEGTVFALYPNDDTLDWAERIKPGAKKAYLKYMSNTGHHHGAFGYARMSENDGKIVIDNLQTDLDAPGFVGIEDSLSRTYNDYQGRYERAKNNLEKTEKEYVNKSESEKEIDRRFIQRKKEEADYHEGRLNEYKELKPALAWWFGTIKKFWAPYLLDIIKEFSDEYDAQVFLTSFEMQSEKWSRIPKRNRDIYDKLPEMMGMNDVSVEVRPEDLPQGRYDMKRVAEDLFQLVHIFCKRAETHSTE